MISHQDQERLYEQLRAAENLLPDHAAKRTEDVLKHYLRNDVVQAALRGASIAQLVAKPSPSLEELIALPQLRASTAVRTTIATALLNSYMLLIVPSVYFASLAAASLVGLSISYLVQRYQATAQAEYLDQFFRQTRQE